MLCGVSFCSIFFPKAYNIFHATVQNFFLKTLKTTANTFFFGSSFALAQLYLGVGFCCACLRL